MEPEVKEVGSTDPAFVYILVFVHHEIFTHFGILKYYINVVFILMTEFFDIWSASHHFALSGPVSQSVRPGALSCIFTRCCQIRVPAHAVLRPTH